MNWTADQQAMLEAMGYTLWRRAGNPVVAPAAGAAAPSRVAPAAQVDDSAVVAPAGRVGDPLLRALQRAAGGRDLASLPLPPLDQLRGDANAKRDLWPRLRALRRRG
jgi:hypothetical protein